MECGTWKNLAGLDGLPADTGMIVQPQPQETLGQNVAVLLVSYSTVLNSGCGVRSYVRPRAGTLSDGKLD